MIEYYFHFTPGPLFFVRPWRCSTSLEKWVGQTCGLALVVVGTPEFQRGSEFSASSEFIMFFVFSVTSRAFVCQIRLDTNQFLLIHLSQSSSHVSSWRLFRGRHQHVNTCPFCRTFWPAAQQLLAITQDCNIKLRCSLQSLGNDIAFVNRNLQVRTLEPRKANAKRTESSEEQHHGLHRTLGQQLGSRDGCVV